jgi:hypothetical protein
MLKKVLDELTTKLGMRLSVEFLVQPDVESPMQPDVEPPVQPKVEFSRAA